MKRIEKQTRLVSIGLAMFLQCAPVCRVIEAVPGLAPAAAYVLKFIALAAGALGAVQAVTGASVVLITSPTNSIGTNGTAYRYRITENSPSADPGVWYNALPLAPGLVINTNTGIITGTPTNTGIFVMNLTAGYLDLRAIPTNTVLTVYGKPVINTQPVSTNVDAGSDATFSVGVTALPAPTYFWRFGANLISSTSNATLAISNASAANAGGYTVIVSNFLGSVTSSVATLTIASGSPVAFTLQPQNRTALVGSNVTFTTAVTGAMPITIQWWKGAAPVPNATSSNLTLGPLTSSDAGGYFVIASNSLGPVNSSTGVLNVVHVPSIAAVEPVGASTRLRFLREPGPTYQVVSASAVGAVNWPVLTNYPAVVVATATWFTNAPTNGPAQFFRVRMTIP